MVVAVHHHMEAEDMAEDMEVAAMEIHLDLAASLPGGRHHYRTRGGSLPSILEEFFLARCSPATRPQCSIVSR